MTRANVLSTAETRAATNAAPVQFGERGPVIHARRVSDGSRPVVVLSWSLDALEFVAYLREHYAANRRAAFDVDLGDGAGFVAYRYASPPRFTATTSGAGSYTISIRKDKTT